MNVIGKVKSKFSFSPFLLLKIFNLLQLLQIITPFTNVSVVHCQPMSNQNPNANGNPNERIPAFRVPFGSKNNLKKVSLGNGATVIDGEIVLTSDLLIQRVTPRGSAYHLFVNPSGPPIYRRKEMDSNRQVVAFPDPNFPPGSGHYVVLKKLVVRGLVSAMREPVYQGLYLILGDSLHAFMTSYVPGGGKQTSMNQQQQQNRNQPNKRLGMNGLPRTRTYDVEFTDVDFSTMVKRAKRKPQDEFGPIENFSSKISDTDEKVV